MPSCVKGIRVTAEKKERSGQGRREGECKGGGEWKDRRRKGEERQEVDFVPSCKNS